MFFQRHPHTATAPSSDTPRKLRICQLCAVDFTLKHFLLPLIDGMRQRGWDVTAVCSDGSAIAELRDAGYNIETVGIARSMNPLLAISSLIVLIHLFHTRRFDVLHVHTPVAALIGRVAARITEIPLIVYTAHGFYFHDEMPRWERKFFIALERLGGRFTDLLFSQSEEDTRNAIHEGICSPSQIVTIGNGTSPRRFDPELVGDSSDHRKALGIPPGVFVIGCIARQVREKGIIEFIQAAELVSARHPDVWFLLIGERLPSDHASSVDRELAVARATLGSRLVISGLRDDIPQCLAAMDVFCLPSWREGMPRTIIEAMMMGKPVIATNIRGAREQVVEGDTGLLVPVRAFDKLANAMSQLVLQPTLARQMGNAGRTRALTLFDERRVVELQLERIELEARSRGLLF